MYLFVRDLRFDESQKLNRGLLNSRNGIQMRRAQVIALSGQGMRRSRDLQPAWYERGILPGAHKELQRSWIFGSKTASQIWAAAQAE